MASYVCGRLVLIVTFLFPHARPLQLTRVVFDSDVLNFVLLSSIVLEQWACLKCFFPMSFRSIGLYLLWWGDIADWAMINGPLFRIG